MKIVQNTPDLLIAEARPWAFVFLFATCVASTVVCVAMGAITNSREFLFVSLIVGSLSIFVSALFAFHVVRVTLDRGLGTVIVTKIYLRKRDETAFRLNDMIEANTWEDMSLRYLAYRAYGGVRPPPSLALIFATADPPDIHIVPGWRPGESAIVGVANTINAWLSMDVDSQPPQA